MISRFHKIRKTVQRIWSPSVLPLNFNLVVLTQMNLQPKTILNINLKSPPLIIQFILNVWTQYQVSITSHWKMLISYTIIHMNVPFLILLKQIFILTFHQFTMTPLPNIQALLHMKYMQHPLINFGKIVK